MLVTGTPEARLPMAPLGVIPLVIGNSAVRKRQGVQILNNLGLSLDNFSPVSIR